MAELRIRLTGARAMELAQALLDKGYCQTIVGTGDSYVVDMGSTETDPNAQDVDEMKAATIAMAEMVRSRAFDMGLTVEVL